MILTATRSFVSRLIPSCNLTKSALADRGVQRVLSDMSCRDAGRLWQILQSLRSMLRQMWRLVLVVLRYLVVLEMVV
jgi:hypothetical protein